MFRDDDLLRFMQSLARAGPAAAGAGLFWIPMCFCVVGLKRLFGAGTIKRLDRAMLEQSCPNCGRGLGSLPRVLGVVCPPACPECGAAWPLLPPGLATDVDGVSRPRMDTRAATSISSSQASR